MLARVYSCAVVGMDATLIEVEVDHENRGLRSFVIVGLPDAAVVESRDRVQAAIKNSGLFVPGHRLTVNLAPANVRKEGPSYDLPIAVGALIASGQLPPENLEGAMVVGELSLDGTVRHVRGILAMAAGAGRRIQKTLPISNGCAPSCPRTRNRSHSRPEFVCAGQSSERLRRNSAPDDQTPKRHNINHRTEWGH